MLLFGKTLHVFALGLWFGTAVFFTLTGVLLFQAFEDVSARPRDARPVWFPLPDAYDRELPGDQFPKPLRKEQGARAAGTAVSPLFPWYFGIQGVCACVTAATALAWAIARRGENVHRARAAVLLLALISVGVGWWLERVVSGLRGPRNDAMDAVLLSPTPSPEAVAAAERARAEFGRWHGYSLVANFATLLLVAAAMALAAQLPAPVGEPKPTAGKEAAAAPVGALG
jgi:hypothetical protein